MPTEYTGATNERYVWLGSEFRNSSKYEHVLIAVISTLKFNVK